MRRTLSAIGLACALVLTLSAHIGSPNVVFDGKAGPYGVRVIVRPPSVVPGTAEVIVQLESGDGNSVSIRPVFWRAGAAGAPKADDAVRVAGRPNLYTGQLWLMSRGSYSVYVTVNGSRGSGTVIVPVAALATGRLGVSRGLGAMLVVLGVLLFAGLVTIVQAASGEALLEPGQEAGAMAKSRARIAGLIAAPILGLLVLGGAKWWGAVDADYRRFMYKAPSFSVGICYCPPNRTLRLPVRDTAAFRTLLAPVVPDHGKMMHLFVISAGNHEYFAHLHPKQDFPDWTDSLQFSTELPWLSEMINYRLFGDIVLANGTSQTVSTTLDLQNRLVNAITPSDSDDSYAHIPSPTRLTRGAVASLGEGYTISWTGGDPPIASQSPIDLRFEVRDAKGAVTSLQPYLGMAGHAVVLRSDESVFIHLHPMGTVATAAQSAFAARHRGDTTASGRLHLAASDTMSMPMSMDGRLDFPYEFPKAGRYRIWVQVKPDKQVLTAAFDVDVR